MSEGYRVSQGNPWGIQLLPEMRLGPVFGRALGSLV